MVVCICAYDLLLWAESRYVIEIQTLTWFIYLHHTLMSCECNQGNEDHWKRCPCVLSVGQAGLTGRREGPRQRWFHLRSVHEPHATKRHKNQPFSLLFLLLFILIFTPMSSNSISLKYGMDNSTQEQHQCKFLLSVGVQKTGSLKWVLVLM